MTLVYIIHEYILTPRCIQRKDLLPLSSSSFFFLPLPIPLFLLPPLLFFVLTLSSEITLRVSDGGLGALPLT